MERNIDIYASKLGDEKLGTSDISIVMGNTLGWELGPVLGQLDGACCPC